MERLRVALLTEYPVDRGITGGIEAVSVTLARALARLPELDVSVVTCRSDVARDASTTNDGVRVYCLKSPRPRLVSRALRDAWKQARLLKALTPDVVHAHAAHLAWAALKTSLPVVWTPHAVLQRQARLWRGVGGAARRQLYLHFERHALGLVPHVIEISPYIGQQLRPMARGRFHPIENPLDDQFFQPRPVTFQGPLLFVGRIYHRKGLHVLVQALVKARAMGAQPEVEVVGDVFDQEYQRQLQRLIRGYGLEEQVRFVGHCEGPGLIERYALCRALVVPSLDETAPMVVAEAMALGKPVVASDVCGLPWMVRHGETGYLVPPGEAEPLARCLTWLWHNDALCQRMGNAAREEARQRFRADTVARRTLEVYRLAAQQAMAGGGRGATERTA